MPEMQSFDQGELVHVALVNHSKIPFSQWKSGPRFDLFVRSLQQFANLVTSFWGGKVMLRSTDKPLASEWELWFVDDADVAQALGYHDVTAAGLPRGLVFVRPTIENDDAVSATAAHELAEMIADPCINLCAQRADGTVYAYEICDPVETEEFAIQGVPMSNFILPAWFEESPRPRRDYLKTCKAAFEIRPGGYMLVSTGSDWTQTFGSEAARERYHKERCLGLHRRSGRRRQPLTSACLPVSSEGRKRSRAKPAAAPAAESPPPASSAAAASSSGDSCPVLSGMPLTSEKERKQ